MYLSIPVSSTVSPFGASFAQANSCPACDYERGDKGRPQCNGEQMTCLDCGATWRELSNQKNPILDKQAYREKIVQGMLPAWNNLVGDTPKQSGYTVRGSNRSPFFLAGIAGLVFLFCLAASVFILQSLGSQHLDRTVTGSISKTGLELTEVKLEEKVRPEGKKVFTVHALLSNSTGVTKAVPRIAIILRHENGNEIFRWHYNSPLPALEDGRKLRFATSVQYDTPMAAYAEAKFE